jgi:hypothetical protein
MCVLIDIEFGIHMQSSYRYFPYAILIITGNSFKNYVVFVCPMCEPNTTPDQVHCHLQHDIHERPPLVDLKVQLNLMRNVKRIFSQLNDHKTMQKKTARNYKL